MASQTLTGKEYNVFRGIEGKVTATPTTIPELRPNEVLIRITHSGICYTDYEYYSNGAPLAMGHEGAGVVEAVGSEVKTLKVGDRAGGGFHKNSCGHCDYCLTGRDIYCYERTVYGEGDFSNGTFGKYFIGKEGYVHKTPEGLTDAEAAPLQCAGATTYSAVVDTTKPRDRVGVVGIGGLGHLAIQFAAKLGHDVVVFSSSKDKEEEARGFGASEFILMSEPDKVSAPVNVLIVAGSRYPDWSKFLTKEVLARYGTIVPLSAPTHGPMSLP
jgi:D-arabinose 1-dehydrogenase-like Zn-dependent alcohol dehydrogenase